jgi:hypothetical protein
MHTPTQVPDFGEFSPVVESAQAEFRALASRSRGGKTTVADPSLSKKTFAIVNGQGRESP